MEQQQPERAALEKPKQQQEEKAQTASANG